MGNLLSIKVNVLIIKYNAYYVSIKIEYVTSLCNEVIRKY